MSKEKTRQEEAFEYVTQQFTKLLMGDMKMPADRKKDVIAFWKDVFEYEGTRDNMIQAFSNFLFEIDEKMDAARKAGIAQCSEAIKNDIASLSSDEVPVYKAGLKAARNICSIILLQEMEPAEKTIDGSELENMDLSEVGGGNEDDTSPL